MAKVKQHIRNGRTVRSHTRQTGMGVTVKTITSSNQLLKVESEGVGDCRPDPFRLRQQGGISYQ